MTMQPEIIYQDKYLAVAVKPAGVISESPGMPELLRDCLGGEFFCVHRLDAGVGGVMVYARTGQAAARLSGAVAQRSLTKEYLAVVQGRPEQDRGVLRDLLFHDKRRNKTYVVDRMRRGVKEAELEYTVIGSAKDISLLRIRLHTGRAHQIRVQFASRAMPLLGDARYGSRYRNCGIALWSERLCFPHPFAENTLDFRKAPPEDYPWSEFSSSIFAE